MGGIVRYVFVLGVSSFNLRWRLLMIWWFFPKNRYRYTINMPPAGSGIIQRKDDCFSLAHTLLFPCGLDSCLYRAWPSLNKRASQSHNRWEQRTLVPRFALRKKGPRIPPLSDGATYVSRGNTIGIQGTTSRHTYSDRGVIFLGKHSLNCTAP